MEFHSEMNKTEGLHLILHWKFIDKNTWAKYML